MLLITDGRFSGGTTGLCVGHVAPEAADEGPIALVHEGDEISIDLEARTLELLVSPDELQRRRHDWQPLPPRYTRGCCTSTRSWWVGVEGCRLRLERWAGPRRQRDRCDEN